MINDKSWNKFNLKEGDRIIWDSHHGYDIGYFVTEDSNQYFKYKVNMVTGVVTGICEYPVTEILPYDLFVEEMTSKYGYNLKFKGDTLTVK
jgi:hypothetical protein